ncbi:MAG TPA: pirin family protein [Kofleriaceae bacterium]|jgi:redox-sensitive bicupin YhaK (pirin superfamily)|nr:pirin family protein [Kofleriaceae bacterium]
MSWTNVPPPVCEDADREPDVELVIEARTRDLGDLIVGRVLPSPRRRLVGPFIFFDHMGPAELAPGRGLNVRPHPHINLATVTYLFEGEIMHRDSLGSAQVIRPGAINWMTAGRGIVHSERTDAELASRGSRVHGLQLWVALPTAHEETEPQFDHYPAESLPALTLGGAELRVLAGEAYGVRSPVRTLSRLFYVDVLADGEATVGVPDGYPERAAYVVAGAVRCGEARVERGTMLVLAPGRSIRLAAEPGTRLVLLGGEPLDGPRHIYWNFVSSSPERIERAKHDWKERRFPLVPGDEAEFIPLPD